MSRQTDSESVQVTGRQHVFTDKEAAEFLRMSQIKLWRERKAGKIAFRRSGGTLIYTRSDLDAYLDRCLQPAVA